MSERIIDLQDWLQSPPGRYLLSWERAQMDLAVADIFGFHALQLGLPELDALAANRMQHRWLATNSPASKAHFVTDYSALPFSAHSLDLVVLPHSLELTADPHTALREVERVLVPEGRMVICGLNPASLWAMRMRRARLLHRLGVGQDFLPSGNQFIGFWRLRDWLRLLGFEVEVARFGCYRPALQNEKWFDRLDVLERLGSRWWSIFGAVYFLVAVKRVRGMTLLSPGWKAARPLVTAPVSVTGYVDPVSYGNEIDLNVRNLD
jgi:SAM-dependent methyltransferase